MKLLPFWSPSSNGCLWSDREKSSFSKTAIFICDSNLAIHHPMSTVGS